MNLGKMMKQAQELQSKMAEMQERLADAEVEGSAGAGMVTAVMSGKHELRRLKIDPTLIDPSDTEVLEDLIVAAVNDARTRVEEHVKEEMSKLTGGLNLPPGMNLPF
ncbi:MAG: YbaB/EbfC family nucleoid-associated protein [Pseudomonadota bacterium]